jgi:CubicO group peptidase (beta-lactamase class C family)
MDIGLGWHIIKSAPDQAAFWHNGGTGGYSSSCVFDPERKVGVIILSNVSALGQFSGIVDRLSFDLIKSFGN